jgi:hypothetical protein
MEWFRLLFNVLEIVANEVDYVYDWINVLSRDQIIALKLSCFFVVA